MTKTKLDTCKILLKPIWSYDIEQLETAKISNRYQQIPSITIALF